MQQQEEIVVRLKPQKPTFTDDADDLRSETKNKNAGECMERFQPGDNIDDLNGKESEEVGMQNNVVDTNTSGILSASQKNTNTTNSKGNSHSHKPRPPPISSVDIDNIMLKEINELVSLSDLEPIASMAIFQRLVDDLMELYRIIEENPKKSIDLRSLIFKGMGDILVDRQEMKKKVEKFKANGPSEPLDNIELKNPFPVMLKEDMMKMADAHKQQHHNFVQKLKSRSNERLEIPLKQNSKIDSNFDELANMSLDSDDFKKVSGCYHINIDAKLHEELCSKFYLKKSPPMSVTKYLERVNRLLCPSTASLLTAAYFLFNTVFNLKPSNMTCVVPLEAPPEDEGEIQMSPVNSRNIFRLILGCLRLSLKLIEDKNYKQRYYCKVVGMQNMPEMLRLELAEMFMLDSHLFINQYVLTRFIFQFKVFDHNVRLFFASMK